MGISASPCPLALGEGVRAAKVNALREEPLCPRRTGPNGAVLVSDISPKGENYALEVFRFTGM